MANVWQVRNEDGFDAGNDLHMAIFETETQADEWITEIIELGNPGIYIKHQVILSN